jgi:hypothetical protein
MKKRPAIKEEIFMEKNRALLAVLEFKKLRNDLPFFYVGTVENKVLPKPKEAAV